MTYLSTFWHLSEEDLRKRRGKISPLVEQTSDLKQYGDGKIDGVRKTGRRWTGSLILSIDSWIRRNFVEINYFLTQFLSGHGYFRQYLHRMGKVTDAGCVYSEETSDNAENTLFYCIQWQDEKNMLIRVNW